MPAAAGVWFAHKTACCQLTWRGDEFWEDCRTGRADFSRERVGRAAADGASSNGRAVSAHATPGDASAGCVCGIYPNGESRREDDTCMQHL